MKPSQRAVAAAARGSDDDGLAWLDHGLVAAFEALHAAVGAAQPVFTALPGISALEAEGRDTAMASEQRHVHGFAKAHDAHRAVAAVPSPPAARAPPDRKAFEEDGVAEFEDFGIGEARVGHV